MNTNTIIIFSILILSNLVLAFFVFRANSRVSRLLQGKDAKSLEETFTYIIDEVKRLNDNQVITEKTLHNLNNRLRKSLTGFRTIRFNPFPEQGGNQSFAIALINEEGDGLVLSSLYSREKTSMFAKPIKKGIPEFELTEEEKTALKEAR
jgi:hypothetical protein